jgi:hypothetical protein
MHAREAASGAELVIEFEGAVSFVDVLEALAGSG